MMATLLEFHSVLGSSARAQLGAQIVGFTLLLGCARAVGHLTWGVLFVPRRRSVSEPPPAGIPRRAGPLSRTLSSHFPTIPTSSRGKKQIRCQLAQPAACASGRALKFRPSAAILFQVTR
ncbi:uncharacterized protein B0H64DRAFT_188661 [Chaetomium fimeti]|uniref:Uncharacterized protein n=1 Tax=Chaetomium fimeti TaxID=1854472 RepID=A0AAE0LR72_9PEZI|nr:hypothetical protein B0H64DRAFT_188661 [Chaetomium fimeti]